MNPTETKALRLNFGSRPTGALFFWITALLFTSFLANS